MSLDPYTYFSNFFFKEQLDGSMIRVATCALNQHALDYKNNATRIIKSIEIARQQGCSIRTGPELELCGYGCEGHFHEADLEDQCWVYLALLLSHTKDIPILFDTGMPVTVKSVRYNCRIFCYQGEIILIRPKIAMATTGNYRETRYFAAANPHAPLENIHLPHVITSRFGQTTAPFGVALINASGTRIASEICEELWATQAEHIRASLCGADIIVNGSASHFCIGKHQQRNELLQHASLRSGAIYLYANQIGCDGGGLYFDGCASIWAEGKCYGYTDPFFLNTLDDVNVTIATFNLRDLRTQRQTQASRAVQAVHIDPMSEVKLDANLLENLATYKDVIVSKPVTPPLHTEVEELYMVPACWMWDYLRRCSATKSARGFFLPLSGGADSSASAACVALMCNCLFRALEMKNEAVIQDLRSILHLSSTEPIPSSAKQLTSRLLHTCYMETSNNSIESKQRAARVAADIGSTHHDCHIGAVVQSMQALCASVTKKPLTYETRAGSLTLQNLQARLRMVTSYLLAPMLDPTGFLLVLGSSNLNEAATGYFTKYDCSSADINPIGGLTKHDINQVLQFASQWYPSLQEVVQAVPSAELLPVTDGKQEQTDEGDMGMSYADITSMCQLRMNNCCGPISMYRELRKVHGAKKAFTLTKTFWDRYITNRHKMSTLTVSVFMRHITVDDNRYDERPIFYPAMTDIYEVLLSIYHKNDES